MSKLFSPLQIKNVRLKNRIVVSPMCQYSAVNGVPNDWHLVHLGTRAVGGAGLIIAEATAVSPEGRISPDDLGIWNDEQTEAFKKITTFIKQQNSVPAIQLAHAGRKASTYAPWKGKGEVKIENGGWQTIAPSPEKFIEDFPEPKEMTNQDIQITIENFRKAAIRSVEAGFEIIELHFAHGYLAHQFLSPFSNFRKDEFGGSLENRTRFALEIARTAKNSIPENFPLFVRISATDWAENGWNLEQSIYLVKKLKEIGIDLIDCSSGGNLPYAKIPVAPGYQVQFAEKIKKETGILTGAVGMITDPIQAEEILSEEKADMILMAREFLRNPYWCFNAAKILNVEIDFPDQYVRAK